MTEHESFQTLSERGLDYTIPPMRLWEKSKKYGIWNPRDIDLSQDREDWEEMTDDERRLILHLTSLFLGGEESVTLDLLPLISVIAAEGHLEEEMYLTTFLFEEAKHVESFRLFLDEVVQEKGDLSHFHTPSYKEIFCRQLPQAMSALRDDPSPLAQARASTTYNMIVEGVLAETGYHAFYQCLARNEILPGLQEISAKLKQDESRHLAYGVFLLSRLVAEHGEEVWKAIEDRLEEMLPLAIGMITEVFDSYEVVPFGLKVEEFTGYAMGQFQKRRTRIERAREQTLDEVYERDN